MLILVEREEVVRHVLHIVISAGLIWFPVLPAVSQEIRMANGVILKGDVRQANDGGLEIQSAAGTKTYPWETLSSATRFRYQPRYRANFDAILHGLPPSMRTNSSPLRAIAAQTDALKPVTEVLRPPPIQPRSLRVFDQAPYEHVDVMSPSQLSNLRLRTPKSAMYLGLHYGPAKTDVIYMIFDSITAKDMPDSLYLYNPMNPAYSNAVRLSGSFRGTPRGYVVEFKKFKLNARFGLVMADYEIGCTSFEGHTNEMVMTIIVNLYKGNTKNEFVLSGQEANLSQGEGIIIVNNLLDLPVLRVRLDLSTGSPRLVGNLNMSHLRLIPKKGMDNRVWLTLIDDKGDVIQREAIPLDESTLTQPYGIVCELKRIEAGKAYLAKAAIDLGPYIGPAVFEEKITIPGPDKK